jgi:hypothetical protein
LLTRRHKGHRLWKGKIMVDIPQELIRDIRRREVVPFIGAGMSMEAGLPGGRTLMRMLAEAIDYPLPFELGDNLFKIAGHYAREKGRFNLILLLRDKLRGGTPKGQSILALLARRGLFNVIITTNYDTLIERALRQAGIEPHVIRRDTNIPFERPDEVQLVKLHGCIEDEKTIVITEDDYSNFFESRPQMATDLKSILGKKTFLFIGYGLEDPNFVRILDEIRRNLGAFKRPAYSVQPEPQNAEERKRWRFYVEDLKHKGVKMIPTKATGFLKELQGRVTRSAPDFAEPRRVGKFDLLAGHVFICYAREDENFVLKLAENLKRHGVRVWLDQWDIPPGADWDEAIDEAISKCAQFLIVLSQAAKESPEVKGELHAALSRKKPILPVLYRTCSIPRQLLTTHYVDFTARGLDDGAALGKVLDALGVSEPPPAVATATTTTTLRPPGSIPLYPGIAGVEDETVFTVVDQRAERLFNREPELEIFQRILRGQSPMRGVVVHSRGKGGWGKSSLLVMFYQECLKCEPRLTKAFPFSSQEVPVSWDLILEDTARKLGRVHFPKYFALAQAIAYSEGGPLETPLEVLTYAGTVVRAGHRIVSMHHEEFSTSLERMPQRVAEGSTHGSEQDEEHSISTKRMTGGFEAGTPSLREQYEEFSMIRKIPTRVSPEQFWQRLLTDVFLKELGALPEPAQIVWLVDTIEATAPETRTWLSNMLGRIASQQTHKVILVVAGKEPLPYDDTWRDKVCELDLKGLPREAIRQIAESRGIRGDERTMEKLAELLEDLTSGNPFLICVCLDSVQPRVQAERR